MRLRWSPAAADDLEDIVTYIRKDNPSAAQRVAQAIYDRAEQVGRFPHLGRRGRIEGTRELAVAGLPFIVVYRTLEQVETVEIVNVIHGARRWPPDK